MSELLDGIREYFSVVVGTVKGIVGRLFYPEVGGRFEVVSEDGDDLLDLLVLVSVHKEVEVLSSKFSKVKTFLLLLLVLIKVFQAPEVSGPLGVELFVSLPMSFLHAHHEVEVIPIRP